MSPNNQNPVFTDNETITGDGTVENPLAAAGSGGITEITSDDGSVTITDPTGPTVDLSVVAGAVGKVGADTEAGPTIVTAGGSLQVVGNSGDIALPGSGSWQALVICSFLIDPETGATSWGLEFQRHSDGQQIGFDGAETVQTAADTCMRCFMGLGSSNWIDGDSVDALISAVGNNVSVSQVTVAVLLIPASL